MGRDLGLVGWQIRYEQRAYWRNRGRGIFTFAFPLMFLVIFASLNKGQHLSTRGNIPYNAFFSHMIPSGSRGHDATGKMRSAMAPSIRLLSSSLESLRAEHDFPSSPIRCNAAPPRHPLDPTVLLNRVHRNHHRHHMHPASASIS